MRRGARAAAAISALLTTPARALAHTGQPIEPHDLLTSWALDPWILLSIGILTWGYGRGLRVLWRTGAGRGVRTWEANAYLGGMLTLAIALVSPIHPLGEVLFSGHMVQHELMMALAAPLVVLGRPLIVLLWAVPLRWRRRAGRWAKSAPIRTGWRTISRPFLAFVIHAFAIWSWHLPFLYQASLASPPIHMLQHLSFLGSAVLFWHAILHGRESRSGYGAAVFYLFATTMHTGGLGALLTFARRPWYTAYEATAGAWGLTALEDQQLAGLIMWIPGGITYLVAGMLLLMAWMNEAERRTVRWQDRLLMKA